MRFAFSVTSDNIFDNRESGLVKLFIIQYFALLVTLQMLETNELHMYIVICNAQKFLKLWRHDSEKLFPVHIITQRYPKLPKGTQSYPKVPKMYPKGP